MRLPENTNEGPITIQGRMAHILSEFEDQARERWKDVVQGKGCISKTRARAIVNPVAEGENSKKTEETPHLLGGRQSRKES